ncbi:precorrin-6y C5,15-methyltransferase (decarboxylating) subunit CbiE [Intrasporangium sp. YIM S08009]|uniref:precorrin-6y C5,15-methyltransferase (decarboxylating) subunit CbiE n=1 Tax=Intrasporangium zincisolvens TaxID=3080018 RepID=UPI002B0603CD|nr:precorrin-6y C5,15-methyltransferase (decarboxylating) subunit CbiE [Intrasporangium sp. YIM S08009]
MVEVIVEVVGVGASGLSSLGADARRVVDAADVLVGGTRHLELAADLVPSAERMPWPSPLLPGLRELLGRVAGRRVVVLASGDPLVSGIGSTLVSALGPDAVRIHPGVSSVALARARMRWSAEESDAVTLVGRDVDRLRRELAPGRRLVVLTSGPDAPDRVCGVLTEEGYASSRVTVLGHLGADDETRTDGVAATWPGGPAPTLHLVCVECVPDAGARPLSLSPGLPDDAFDHDGQLTKRVVRAAALAHLAPQPGDVLWDLGAGAGSVGIEFARQHPRNHVMAVERDPVRAERVRANARRLGVPGLEVVEARSADVVDDLPAPDAVFVGGGASADLLDRAWAALLPGGRIVVHGVTVETELLLHDARARLGGALTRIAVEDLEPLGSLTGWKPARAVVQWSATKPHPATEEPA